MKKAIYAASFDMPTLGHEWMIRETAKMFDHLIVAVGKNPTKNTMFNVEQRVGMLKVITGDLKNVEVSMLENVYLVDYAKQKGANYIIRGIRNIEDYRYEHAMRQINNDLSSESVTTVFLMPPRELIEVSSSMVKSLIGFEGWKNAIRRYVPESIAKILEEKFSE